jgi:hypothetical protein
MTGKEGKMPKGNVSHKRRLEKDDKDDQLDRAVENDLRLLQEYAERLLREKEAGRLHACGLSRLILRLQQQVETLVQENKKLKRHCDGW